MRPFVTPALALTALVAAIVAPRLVGAVGAPPTPAPPVATLPPTTPPTAVDQPQVHVRLDREAVLAGGQLRAELTLMAPRVDETTQTLPTDLVLVVDRSGSMGGQKIADARAAAHSLVDLLGVEDRVAMVSFSDSATLDMPLANANARSHRFIDRLRAGGGTELQAGLDEALDLLAEPAVGRARRIVLLSDGQPNHREGLDMRAQQAARMEAPLTAVGIGADYDIQLLQSLADQGTGNFYWANAQMPLHAVFADEFSASRSAVTARTALQWSLPPGVTVADWGGLPSQGDTVELGQLFSGQRRLLWVTLQVAPGVDTDRLDLGSVTLDTTDPHGVAGVHVAQAGAVAVTHDAAVVAQGLDAEGWATAVVEDEYNSVLGKVSGFLSRGDKSSAMQELQAYQVRNERLNAQVGSSAVADNLVEVQALQQQVDQDQVGKLGVVDLATKAYHGRRKGQTWGSMPAPRPTAP